ncbi:MAG: GDYXXLXY domain-containing protein [Bacteroidota bacterium]
MHQFKQIVFWVLMITYIAYPLSLIQGYVNVAEQGQAFRLRPRPVDPFDNFRGSYVTLSYDNFLDYPSADQQFHLDKVIYLQLNQEADGFAQFSTPTAEPPGHSSYFRTRITQLSENGLRFQIPDNLQRYYLPADMALLAERAYRELARRNAPPNSIYIDIRVKDGQIVIEELFLEELPIKTYLRQKLEELETSAN